MLLIMSIIRTPERIPELELKEKNSLHIEAHQFVRHLSTTLKESEPEQKVKTYHGYKVVIDETKGNPIPKTMAEMAQYLPDDMKYYTKMRDKGTGMNKGYFCLMHFEYRKKTGEAEIKPQWVLLKKSNPAQDISEYLTGIVQNILSGDKAASIGLCVEQGLNGEHSPYVISIMYPGFQDSWKRFYAEHNAFLLQHGKKTLTVPQERPKFIGSRNKFIQNGIGDPVKDLPEIAPSRDDFYDCMALSFFSRNYDFHFSNVGCIFRNADSGDIIEDEKQISQLKTYIKNQERALANNNLEDYQLCTTLYETYKASHKIKESFALIDFGWAGAHWETYIKRAHAGDLGFASRDLLLHTPGIAPTNHFREIKRTIKYREPFANALRQLANKYDEEQEYIYEQLQTGLDKVEKYYGETGLHQYAAYVGLSLLTQDHIKEQICDFLVMRAYKTEAYVARKLAFMIRLSLCFPENGSWGANVDGSQHEWHGEGTFTVNPVLFGQLLDTYMNENHHLLGGVNEDYFLGFNQELHKTTLLQLFKTEYKKATQTSEVKEQQPSPKKNSPKSTHSPHTFYSPSLSQGDVVLKEKESEIILPYQLKA